MLRCCDGVTFIIPAKNEELNIRRCISAIKAQSDLSDYYSILVIDNGSVDNTIQIARDLGAVVYVCVDKNISGLRNYGAALAKGTYLAFVDADIEITGSWLKEVYNLLKDDAVGAVGSSPNIPLYSTWVAKAWFLQKLARPEHFERPWLPSMNMVVRKNAFTAIGGFNEALITGEDVDFGLRLSEKYKIIDSNKVTCIHHGEAQTLLKFFLKEYWRGTHNIHGLFSHGFYLKELPSILFPLLGIISIYSLPISLYNQSFLYIASSFFIFPLLKSAVICSKTNQFRYFAKLLAVWSVYLVARSVSLHREIFTAFIRLAKFQAPVCISGENNEK